MAEQPEPKIMSVTDFVEEGYLMAVNREILHPLGVALAVELNEATGVYRLYGIQDARDDPEGFAFVDFTNDDLNGAANIEEQRERRREARLKGVGYWIQPLPDETVRPVIKESQP